MKNKEILKRVKEITELIKEIRKDDNLVNQDTVRHAYLVEKLKQLVNVEDVRNYMDSIEEIMVLVDINKGFTTTGIYQNPYGQAIVPAVNEEAIKFHAANNKMLIVINESHTEDSIEFETLNPDNPLPHCIEGTEEVEYAEQLKWIVDEYPVFEKNTTMAAHAPGYLDIFHLFPNLRRVKFAGLVTDICYFEATLSTIKYFDEHNMRCEVIAEEAMHDTYDAPWHNRDEWKEMTNKFMAQAGIKLRKKVI